MKILIADDNAAVRRVIRYTVTDLAAEVIECVDGDEVLSQYQKHLPDLVLMDVRMPRTDGLTATRQLKHSYPQARIIMVSDIDDTSTRSLALQYGACGYVLKNNLIELDEVILEALERPY